MLTRRAGLQGGAALVASTIVFTEPTEAIHINLRKVAAVIVQAVNVAVNPAAQVGLATNLLSQAVKKISPDASRALDLVNRITSLTTDLSGGLGHIAAGKIVKALPLFANAGFQAEQIAFFADSSKNPLSVNSSIEQHIRADPSGYIAENKEYLIDFVGSGFDRTAQSFTLEPGWVGSKPVLIDPAGGSQGIFPSVVQITDIARLVSLFKV